MPRNNNNKWEYRVMACIMQIEDAIFHAVPKRVERFDIRESMVVVDYGCGPGRYTRLFAEKIGGLGKVYAVDIEPEAIRDIHKLINKTQAANIVPVLADGFNSKLPANIADRVFALDMFHGIDDTASFLGELRRIAKSDGLIYIDYGHQSKQKAIEKITHTNLLSIVETHSKYVVCKQI